MQWRPRPNHTTIWAPKPGGMFSTGMRARHAATPVKRASCSPKSSERTVERSPSAPMSRSPSSEWPSSKCAVTPSGVSSNPTSLELRRTRSCGTSRTSDASRSARCRHTYCSP